MRLTSRPPVRTSASRSPAWNPRLTPSRDALGLEICRPVKIVEEKEMLVDTSSMTARTTPDTGPGERLTFWGVIKEGCASARHDGVKENLPQHPTNSGEPVELLGRHAGVNGGYHRKPNLPAPDLTPRGGLLNGAATIEQAVFIEG